MVTSKFVEPLIKGSVVNAFTVDVEEYFQVSVLAPYIPRSNWESMPQRIEKKIDRMLELLDCSGNSGTFFVLGWIAERHPQMVCRIANAGHEVASHGYAHMLVREQTEATFREDVVRTKAILEDLTGTAILGFRAPSFSIDRTTSWAHRVLRETGHRYSSSVYPIRHDHYGSPDAPRFAHQIHDQMVEIPPTAMRLGQRNIPAGGGGFFRLLPYSVSRWMIRRVNTVDQQPTIFYCHPWEIDAEQPRVAGIDAQARFRHYVNLSRMEAKISRLLADSRWDRIDRIFGLTQKVRDAELVVA